MSSPTMPDSRMSGERKSVMGKTTLTVPFGTEKITVETGWLAKQASGSVLVTMGETVVLVTVTGNKSARPGVDFLL